MYINITFVRLCEARKKDTLGTEQRGPSKAEPSPANFDDKFSCNLC